MNKQFIISCPSSGRYEVVMRLHDGKTEILSVAILICDKYDQARTVADMLNYLLEGGAK